MIFIENAYNFIEKRSVMNKTLIAVGIGVAVAIVIASAYVYSLPGSTTQETIEPTTQETGEQPSEPTTGREIEITVTERMGFSESP